MNTGQTRIRRTAADLGPVRLEAAHRAQPGHRRFAGNDIAPQEEAALTFLSRILAGDETWSVGEVRRLLDLRDRGLAGLAS